MTDKVRLRDVAQAAGVSQGTASNAFARPDLVSEELRAKVLATAARLGYRGPSVQGRLLRAGRVNAIGVATTLPLGYFFDDPWARAMLSALSTECDARGAGIALVSALNRDRAAWNVESALVDGFILLCVEGEGELLVRLTRKRGLPFLPLSPEWGDPRLPSLLVDNEGGAQAAAAHLAALGHRRVAILALDLDPVPEGAIAAADVERIRYATDRDRLRGYRAGLAGAGIDPDRVPVALAGEMAERTEAALDALWAAPEPPTALLCMSDRVALRAMAALAARGLRVPQDVSVVGFDGVPEAAAAIPPLTTVPQPFEAIARRAVAALLDDAMPGGPETLPLALREAGSTAPPLV